MGVHNMIITSSFRISKSERPGIKNANPGPGSYNAEKKVE